MSERSIGGGDLSETSRTMTRLLLVSNDAMRARRRPRAIVWMWLFQAILAFAVAWPTSRAMAILYGNFPNGDAALFQDGGIAVMNLLARQTVSYEALETVVAFVGAVAWLLGVIPLILLLTSLAFTTQDLRAPRIVHLLPTVARCAWPMVVLIGLSSLLYGALIALAAIVASWAETKLSVRFGEARGGQYSFAIFGLLASLTIVIGVVHDLARASIIRFRVSALGGLRSGWATFRKSKIALVWSWAWRSFASVSLLAGIYVVTLRLGGRPGLALVALAIMHQLVALARVALRASWLARALRAVDT